MLERLVSKCNNNAPVYPVLPGLVFSTDDSTVFVFCGKVGKAKTWHLLLNKDDQDASQSSSGNDKGGTDHLNGLRARIAFTMNATGMLAATFITVTGLMDRELPKKSYSSGVFHLKIPGLCVGAAQDLQHDAVGYLAMYRRERCVVSGTTSE